MKISVILTIIFFIIALTVGVGTTSYYYNQSVKSIEQGVFRHLETAEVSRANHIEDIIKSTLDNLKLAAELDVFQNNLFNIVNGINVEDSTSEIQEAIDDMNDQTNSFYEVYVIDKNGIVVASSIDSDVNEAEKVEIGENLQDDQVFVRGMKGFSIGEPSEQGIDMISFQEPIVTDLSNEPNGVIVISQAFDAKYNGEVGSEKGIGINQILLDKTGLGETGEMYLINEESYAITPLLFVDDAFLKWKVDTIASRDCLEDLEELKEKHEEKIKLYLDYHGEKSIGTHAYLSETKWCLLAEIEESEILGEQRRLLQKVSITIIIAIIILITLVGFFVGRVFDKAFVMKKGNKRL